MSKSEFIIELLKSQVRPLDLNEICACIPAIPRDNVKEMLEWLGERRMVNILPAASPLFSRQFEVVK